MHNHLRYHIDRLEARDDIWPTHRRYLCHLSVTDIEIFGIKGYLVASRNFSENGPAGQDWGLAGVSINLCANLKCLGAYLVAIITGAQDTSISVDKQYKAIPLLLWICSILGLRAWGARRSARFALSIHRWCWRETAWLVTRAQLYKSNRSRLKKEVGRLTYSPWSSWRVIQDRFGEYFTSHLPLGERRHSIFSCLF